MHAAYIYIYCIIANSLSVPRRVAEENGDDKEMFLLERKPGENYRFLLSNISHRGVRKVYNDAYLPNGSS
jgi:hypothetical protein